MRASLSIKALYRSPVRTLLTFILLCVVAFAFFTQAAEYSITAREFRNAAGQYSGVGAVEIAAVDSYFPGFANYIDTDLRSMMGAH